MEHFIITLFWIATLFAYLQAFRTNLMLKEVQCPSDSTFYAPENVKEHCVAAALECVEKELGGTARMECEDPRRRLDQGLRMLQAKFRRWKARQGDHVLTAPGECVCEAWPQAPFREFLAKTKTLTELMDALQADST